MPDISANNNNTGRFYTWNGLGLTFSRKKWVERFTGNNAARCKIHTDFAANLLPVLLCCYFQSQCTGIKIIDYYHCFADHSARPRPRRYRYKTKNQNIRHEVFVPTRFKTKTNDEKRHRIDVIRVGTRRRTQRCGGDSDGSVLDGPHVHRNVIIYGETTTDQLGPYYYMRIKKKKKHKVYTTCK